MVENENILQKATFNKAVKTYIFIVVTFYLIVSIVGILFLPFWLLGLGQWLSNKFFTTLTCEISTRNLRFSKGIIVHIEKTIPLENIQDLSFIGGPILRALKLSIIRVETAGGKSGHSYNMMKILGINNAESFKAAILDQREKLINDKYKLFNSPQQSNSGQSDQLLLDIKNELVEIKEELRKRQHT
ncbi:MAG: PH domain-containing protein [Bacteroidia bacterium]|nr:PH domain-containing protein [Bacteroidia bacterium]